MKTILRNFKTNRAFIFFGILILFISGGIILKQIIFSCFDDSQKLGIFRSSDNLEFAIKNDLLLYKINLSQVNITLSDSMKLKIDEAWVEFGWAYQCVNNKIQIVKHLDIKSFIIRLDNASWSDYDDDYLVVLGDDYGGTVNGNIVFDADNLNNNTILVYRLKERYSFKGDKTLVDSIRITR